MSKLQLDSVISNLLRRTLIYKTIEGHMHVRITQKGRAVLNNKSLANKVIDAIIGNQQNLIKGEKVKVNGSDISVTLVTTIKEEKKDDCKKTDGNQ